MSRPTFVLFGDSITQFSFSHMGWGAEVQHHYQRHADVLLRGYSGYNTRWCLPILKYLLQTLPADTRLFTICFGANDATLSGDGQHVPLDEYAQNLADMVASIRSAFPHATVVLITPPPLVDAAYAVHGLAKYGSETPNRSNANAGRYADAVMSAAKHLKCPALDIYTKWQLLAKWESFLDADGLHLSPNGNQQLAEALLTLIESEIPSLYVDPMNPAKSALPSDQSHWSEMVTRQHEAEETGKAAAAAGPIG